MFIRAHLSHTHLAIFLCVLRAPFTSLHSRGALARSCRLAARMRQRGCVTRTRGRGMFSFSVGGCALHVVNIKTRRVSSDGSKQRLVGLNVKQTTDGRFAGARGARGRAAALARAGYQQLASPRNSCASYWVAWRRQARRADMGAWQRIGSRQALPRITHARQAARGRRGELPSPPPHLRGAQSSSALAARTRRAKLTSPLALRWRISADCHISGVRWAAGMARGRNNAYEGSGGVAPWRMGMADRRPVFLAKPARQMMKSYNLVAA